MRYLLTFLAVFLLLGCCTGHPDVEGAIKDGIAVNRGHMADEALPEPAHIIAQDNHDFLWQILHGLTGDPLPEDVKARMEARKGGGS